MRNKVNVAFLVDGSFYPIRNGTDYSILTLMNSLAKTDYVNPNLLLIWRGWDNPKDYSNQSFRTIFLPVQNFYNDNNVLEYTMATLDVRFIHIYNAEEVVNLSTRLHAAGVKIIYEAVNIDHVLYSGLNADAETVSSAKETQAMAMKAADFVLCRSGVDLKHIQNMGVSKDKVSVYRGAIDVDAIPFTKRKYPSKKVVFLGHMYYPPNENALALIATHILPALRRIDERYSVTIIGIVPDGTKEKYSKNGLIFRGGVDDLAGELSRYDVAIAPLFEGSGTRLKLLDFMASGIPTISSTLGIEGLHEDITNSLIIEDDIHEYARLIDEIVCDASQYQQLATKGRSYVERNYNWDNNLEPFLNIYRSQE